MKILLVDNLIMAEAGSQALLDVHPHLGLLALAAVAEPAGHTVEIYDPKRLIRSRHLAFDANIYDAVSEELLARRADVVGFTSLGCSFIFALNVAARLKRRVPDLPILLGGPHATMLHREILERFPQFDVVVRHEADEILLPVLDQLERRGFEHIPGISWRTAQGVRWTEGKPKVHDLDTLPIASYDYYPVAELGLDLLRIEAGRGCPFMCTFCSTAGFFQRSFRLKSAARLVRELDLLNARYDYRDFKLDHDMFTVSRRKVLEFCQAVRGRGYRWRASARVDCVDPEMLAQMAEAGCVGLYFGIETGSVRMQEVCRKRLDLQLVEPILAAAEELGIETTASFITGYPQEVEADQDDTLNLLGRCSRPNCLVQLHMLAPEPGTPLFEQLGAEIRYDGYGGRYNAELVGPNDERLVLDHPDIFQTYYYYPAAMSRSRYIFAVEAVDLLRRAGPIILQYVLRAYEGKLARLVSEMRDFAESRGLGPRPDARLLEAYVTSKFGAAHHITSLFRFVLCLPPAPGAPGAAQESAAEFDAGRLYQLSDYARVLRQLHDCPKLIERIRAAASPAALLDDADTGERDTYVVTLSAEGMKAGRLDPGVEAILGLFAQPRLGEDVSQWVREATGHDEVDTTFLNDLVRAAIIVSVQTDEAPAAASVAITTG